MSLRDIDTRSPIGATHRSFHLLFDMNGHGHPLMILSGLNKGNRGPGKH